MQVLNGISAASGIAIGSIRIPERGKATVMRQMKDPLQEKQRFDAANLLAKDELVMLKEQATGEDRDIIEFQVAILSDNGFLKEVYSYIDAGAGAAASVERASGIFEKKMQRIADDYFSERSVDIRDASRRVVDILDDAPRERLSLKTPCIVVADELTPSDMVTLDRNMLLGIVTVKGSKQGHASIIARTMGIPAVVRVPLNIDEIKDGDQIAVDGNTGEIFLYPSEGVKTRFAHRMHKLIRDKQKVYDVPQKPVISKNNVKIDLYANCASPEDITTALTMGATGVGLLRSESIYMGKSLPDEDKQYEFYAECIKAASGFPLTIRTMDIGADKFVRSISISDEPNPALGVRGIRLSLLRRDMFQQQITAILRASVYGEVSVMFPMIATVSDFNEAMEMVARAKYELDEAKIPYQKDVKFGAMIETPAAALCAPELAKKADFFSIGTNDLTQYTHAADRENTLVDSYFLTASTAILRLIDITVKAANEENIPVCVCGESAAHPEIAMRYMELSINILSMSAPFLANMREYIESNDIEIIK